MLAVFAALIVAGQFAGAFVFTVLQKLPREIISITTLMDYNTHYGHIEAVKKTLKLCMGIALLIPIAGTGFLAYAFFSPAARSLHGDARFATKHDLRKAGLLCSNPAKTKYPSLLVGKIGKEFLIFANQLFIILKAATRKGKGVGFVIPNLLWYRDSIIVNDPKKENWKLTAGYRSQCGQECFLFSPDSKDFRSHRWNPLSYIRKDLNRVGDVQTIGLMLYPIPPRGDSFWAGNAQTLFLGLVLYMLDTPGEEVSLPRLVELTTPADGSDLQTWIIKTINARSSTTNPLKHETVLALMAWAGNKSENTRAGILTTLLEPLNICRDPIAALALSGDDFDLRLVRKKRMTVYIGLTPRNFERFGRIVNLFFSQLINENTDELPEDNPVLKYQCALMLDEFVTLGYIEKIKNGVGYLAGYNIRPLLIFQNESQNVEVYGEKGAKNITSNCGLEIVYAPKDNSDAKEYSDSLGYQTVKAKSTSRSSGKTSSNSESTSYQRRALMLPQEIKEIGFEKEILIVEDVRPAIVDKIIYWKDPFFNGKVGLPTPPVPELDISKALNIANGLKAVSAAAIEEQHITDFHNEIELLNAAKEIIGLSLENLDGLLQLERS